MAIYFTAVQGFSTAYLGYADSFPYLLLLPTAHLLILTCIQCLVITALNTCTCEGSVQVLETTDWDQQQIINELVRAPFSYGTYLLSYLLSLAFVLDSAEADPLLFLVFVVAGILVFSYQAFLGSLCLHQRGLTPQLSSQLPALSGRMNECRIGDLPWRKRETGLDLIVCTNIKKSFRFGDLALYAMWWKRFQGGFNDWLEDQ